MLVIEVITPDQIKIRVEKLISDFADKLIMGES